MSRWLANFTAEFPNVTVAGIPRVENTRMFRLASRHRKRLPETEILPHTSSIVPDIVRWLGREGLSWAPALQSAVWENRDVYLSLSALAPSEPRLLEASGLVTVPTSMSLGEIESWLSEKGFTLGLLGSVGQAARLYKVIYGDVFVEPYMAGPALRDRISAVGGVLANGFPFRTKAIPRAAMGPDFKHLIMGNHQARAIVLDATLKVGRIELARPDLWRWLRLRTRDEVVALLRHLGQSDYPWLALRAAEIGKDGLWEVRLAYASGHGLNDPMMDRWEASTELALQSGPMAGNGEEAAPPAPSLKHPWACMAVSYADANAWLDAIDTAFRRAKPTVHIFKPQHDHLLVRVDAPEGTQEHTFDNTLARTCEKRRVRRIYPPVEKSAQAAWEATWLNGLNI